MLYFVSLLCLQVSAAPEKEESHLQHRRLNIVRNKRWKDRDSDGWVVIPYTTSSDFDDDFKNFIRSALDDLENRSGCLKFVPWSSEKHYIKVVQLEEGCSSAIGMQKNSQTINLHSVRCKVTGRVQHEFMHALGFHHEQSRPDRDNYVKINLDKVQRDKEPNFWLAKDSETLGSPYDYGSVMHYSTNAFSIYDNDITIEALNTVNTTIGQRDGASEDDIKKLKLVYQCLSGPRDWDSLVANPCTSDCKCREGETGCGSNDDACHGSLVCSSNKCMPPATSTSTHCNCETCTEDVWNAIATNDQNSFSCGNRITWLNEDEGKSLDEACSQVSLEFPDICFCTPSCSASPPPSPVIPPSPFLPSPTENTFLGPYLVWQVLSDGSFWCMDLMGSNTANGNLVWYYECNYTPAQYWIWDTATNYIRSSVNSNKCLVGDGGSAEPGTILVINDCYYDDDRFKWDWYSDDGSVRPRNNESLCIEVENYYNDIINAGTEEQGFYLILDECNEIYKFWNWTEVADSESKTLLREQGLEPDPSSLKSLRSDECLDSPLGWYDFLGRNCNWYKKDPSNCVIYGADYENFGKTAKSAVSLNLRLL